MPTLNLNDLRKQIDKLDKELVKILAKRFEVTRKVGQYKAKNNLPVQDKSRERKILEKKELLAEKSGLDKNLVNKIFKLIMSTSRKEHKIFRKK